MSVAALAGLRVRGWRIIRPDACCRDVCASLASEGGRHAEERHVYATRGTLVPCPLWHGHLGREPARARCPCHSGRDARTTSHAATPSSASSLFSTTFWLCSDEFEVSTPFSSIGHSVPSPWAGWRRPLPFGVCVSRREGRASLSCPESRTLDGVSAPAATLISFIEGNPTTVSSCGGKMSALDGRR